MIELKKIYTEISENSIYLKSDCIINGEEKTLWYSTAIDYGKYISTSNADSFLLVLFVYSVFNGLKLKSSVAISSELHYGLLEVLLPSFQQMGFDSQKSDFEFQKIDCTTYPDAQGVGTAMTFGVDSLYTFLDTQNHVKTVNILTIFNAGGLGQKELESANKFLVMKERISLFSKATHKKFVWIDTNTNQILKMNFVMTHAFRNFACVFMLPKLFKDYFYASGLTLADFKLNRADTAYYDLLISKAVKGNSLNFHISGLNINRFEKTICLADNSVAKQYLNVCNVSPVKNCSKCDKCVRTMLTLDTFGKLEEFKDVFNIEIFNLHKSKNIGDLIYRSWRIKQPHANEILSEMKKRNYPIPAKAYWFLFLRALEPIKNKLFKNF